jgi:hypothetical protein
VSGHPLARAAFRDPQRHIEFYHTRTLAVSLLFTTFGRPLFIAVNFLDGLSHIHPPLAISSREIKKQRLPPHARDAAVERSIKKRTLLVVLQADFQLANRFVGRAKGFDLMAAEIVGSMVHVSPRPAQGFERVMYFGMTFGHRRLSRGRHWLGIRRGRRGRGRERQREYQDRSRENAYDFHLHE